MVKGSTRAGSNWVSNALSQNASVSYSVPSFDYVTFPYGRQLNCLRLSYSTKSVAGAHLRAALRVGGYDHLPSSDFHARLLVYIIEKKIACDVICNLYL